MIPSRCCFRALVVGLSYGGWWALSPVSAASGPEFHSGLPALGSRYEVVPYQPSLLPVRLRNPESTPLEVILAIRPDRTGNMLIQEERLRLGPGAHWTTALRFLPDTHRDYVQEWRLPTGRLLSRDVMPIIIDVSGERKRPVLIHDADRDPGGNDWGWSWPDPGFRHARLRAAETPSHWLDYERATVVLLGLPDYDAMTHAQYQALLDFVQSGGTLVWLHPDSILAARATPLADLLPIQPLAKQQLEHVRPLQTWARHHQHQERTPTDPPAPGTGWLFLDSELRATATAALEAGGTPWIAWLRFGAGQAGTLLFDALPTILSDTAEGHALRSHIFRWGQRHPLAQGAVFAPELQPAAERLTGFQSVSADAILHLLLSYLALACATLFLSRRRQFDAVGWVALAVMGLMATALILQAAQRRIAAQPERNRIALSVVAPHEGRVTGQQHLTLFTKRDHAPHLVMTSDNRWLPPFFPSERDPILLQPSRRITETLHLKRRGDTEELRNFRLPALRPRSVGAAYALDQSVAREPIPPVQVGYDEQGPYVHDLHDDAWPAGTRTYLTGAHASRLLAKDTDDRWRPVSQADRLARVNPVIAAWEQWLDAGHLPPGRVVRLYPAAAAAPRWAMPYTLEGDYVDTGYTLEMASAVDLQPVGPVRVPPEWVELQPADHRARLLLRPVSPTGTPVALAGTYEYRAYLPPLLANLAIQQITVQLRANDPAMTYRLQAAIQPYGTSDRQLSGTSPEPGLFLFDLPDGAEWVDPATGGFRVRLTAQPATTAVAPGQPPLAYLRVKVRGHPPTQGLSEGVSQP